MCTRTHATNINKQSQEGEEIRADTPKAEEHQDAGRDDDDDEEIGKVEEEEEAQQTTTATGDGTQVDTAAARAGPGRGALPVLEIAKMESDAKYLSETLLHLTGAMSAQLTAVGVRVFLLYVASDGAISLKYHEVHEKEICLFFYQ